MADGYGNAMRIATAEAARRKAQQALRGSFAAHGSARSTRPLPLVNRRQSLVPWLSTTLRFPSIRSRNVCQFGAPIKRHRNISDTHDPTQRLHTRPCDHVSKYPHRASRHRMPTRLAASKHFEEKRSFRPENDCRPMRAIAMRRTIRNACAIPKNGWRAQVRYFQRVSPHGTASASGNMRRQEKSPGFRRGFRHSETSFRNVIPEYQNVMLQLSMRPVSALELSVTRSRQLPLIVSEDRFTLYVVMMLSALAPV